MRSSSENQRLQRVNLTSSSTASRYSLTFVISWDPMSNRGRYGKLCSSHIVHVVQSRDLPHLVPALYIRRSWKPNVANTVSCNSEHTRLDYCNSAVDGDPAKSRDNATSAEHAGSRESETDACITRITSCWSYDAACTRLYEVCTAIWTIFYGWYWLTNRFTTQPPLPTHSPPPSNAWFLRGLLRWRRFNIIEIKKDYSPRTRCQ